MVCGQAGWPEAVLPTCFHGQEPGADEWSESLARFGQQRRGSEHESGHGLLPAMHDAVLVHQVTDHQVQEFTRALREHTVTGNKHTQQMA